jgi:hypothetical protein
MSWTSIPIIAGFLGWIACMASLAAFGAVLLVSNQRGWGIVAILAAISLLLLGLSAIERFA